jgi:hypothetical protein
MGQALSLIASLFALAVVMPAWAGHERLIFEIVETSAGGRSQGWRGTLYDKDGMAVTIEAGAPLKTPVGVFAYVPCVMPWQPCGAIPIGMLHGPDLDRAENVVMAEPWSYRIYAVGVWARPESIRGELIRAGDIVKAEPAAKEIKTPMGAFVWQETPNAAGVRGWVAQPSR